MPNKPVYWELMKP